MASELPPFEPVTLAELRTLYAQFPDPNVRRLVLEIVRHRRVMAEIDSCFKVIQQAWSDKGYGHLIALHRLHCTMNNERFRTPP